MRRLVSTWQAVDAVVLQVDEDVVSVLHGMRERMGGLASTLKVLAADQTGIDVLVREAHGADLLEVEVQQLVVDGVQVRALAALGGALAIGLALGAALHWVFQELQYARVFRIRCTCPENKDFATTSN